MNSDIVIMITFTKIGGKTLFRKLNEFRSPDNNLHFTQSRIFADTELLKWG